MLIRLPLLRHQLGPRAFSSSCRREKQRLVILGSGWGGYEVLRGVDKKRWDVVLVSPNNYFNFTPLLASCAVGTLEFRCAIEPVRRYSPAAGIYQAWCDSIDFRNKVLQCMPATKPSHVASPSDTTYDHQISTTSPGSGLSFPLKYDKLVIAVGAYSQTFNIPGVKEHAHFLKDVRDARAIRSRILECFEQANQPTLSDTERRQLLNFVIVGAGPTGVEFAAELHDLLHAEIWEHYPSLAKMARINLYDVAPSILGMFDSNLVQYAEKSFRREGISIWTSHHVDKVESGKLFIKEQGEVPYGLLVWSTGLSPNPLIASITEFKKHQKSQSIIADDHLNALRIDGTPDPDVYVIGDAASIATGVLPATAQVANQQAKYLYKRLNKIIKDQPHEKPFEFHNQGTLAYVGNWKAIYDRPEEGGLPGLNKEKGRLAWLLWRSAYFTQTLSVRNKILVPFYWFLNCKFRFSRRCNWFDIILIFQGYLDAI
ncbi:pyridine nucleotide-disulfide oxidoreductase-domain-containing protein [Lentinula edodes]|uniref:Pyridine nucleotide-disulfide oxidoreductase-domain-containing protein n=1 Tax=Lentinula lateritia TaxID=40482 RepID=A0A9W9B1T6_9AGAR|nr:pyridine nucleotide-disulfide oxidoreductase-domain-containing protein [Lentinula edodes]